MIPKYVIINQVAEQFNVTPTELVSKSRIKRLANVRVILWAAMREAGYSFISIGKYTNRDHSTVSELLRTAKPEFLGKGREIYDSVADKVADDGIEVYPELYEIQTVRVPDYRKNKIVEIQRVIKKL